MSRDILLGVDIGTTAVRALAFTYDGTVVKDSKTEVKVWHPRPSWAEQDPDEIHISTIKAIQETSRGLGDRIKAIGFSGQMHGLLCVDKNGVPLTKLIPWVDVRAAEQVKKLESMIGAEELYRRTGCPPLFIYVAPKILWVKENMPHIFSRCHKIITAQDYVIFKLFGDYFTNPSLASGSQLLNINDVKWDKKVLDCVGVDETMLPTPVEGDTVLDRLPNNVSRSLGISEGVPVALGASDGSLSNVGLGAVREGVGAFSLGSSGAVRVVSDHPIWDNKMRFFCYYIASRRWLTGGAINNCGIVLRWFRDNFAENEVTAAKKQGVDAYMLLDEQAKQAPAGCEGLMFMPFMSGERFPVRDPYVRGMLFGLSLGHSRAHIIRCIMEGVTFTIRWIQEAIEEYARIDLLKVSGGGARSQFWRQIVSDISGKKVLKTNIEEASAMGAAMMAGIAVRDFRDMNHAAEEMVRDVEETRPLEENHRLYNKMFEVYKDAYANCRTYCEKLLQLEP
ncbi:MAG: xylulokinase [Nitrososphaeria archaeon]